VTADLSETGPYLGPQPFQREHGSVFFGRLGELQQLHTMVLSNPVVLLYAASGAGKTSLLNAGLIPLLEKQDDFQVLPIARVTSPEPDGDAPLEANPYVRGVLSSWLPEGEIPLQAPDLTLADFLDRQVHPEAPEGWAAPRLLVIDQLEEVFTLQPHRWQHRNEFFSQLGAAIEADPLLRVVLAIREDYTYELEPQRVRLPGRLKARFRLELLREPAALEAVVKPLKGTGREFAPGVAEQLVRNLRRSAAGAGAARDDDLLTEFVEPVQLQVTCAALWQALPGDREIITADDVRNFGDVDQALRALYDAAIALAAAESGVEERQLRDDFAEAFITPMDTRGTAYRSEEGVGGMPWAAVNVLDRHHVIRAEWRSRAHWFELTHDRFIPPIRHSNRRFVLDELTGMKGSRRAVPLLLERRGGLTGFTGRRREAEAPAPLGSIDPPVKEQVREGVALCLTGGGYRSMLFTAGVLWRLNDAGYLPRLDHVASNSAAAVSAALLALGWDRLEFDSDGRGRGFREIVMSPLHGLASRTLDTKVAWSSLVQRHSGSEELAHEYKRQLFGDATLQTLPDWPRFVFTASHLVSGELWRFGKNKMGNNRAGWIKQPDVPIAVAVAACGASPPLLSPAVLNAQDGGKIVLTSGSLYDTLALETAWRRYDTVLVSDAKGSRPIAHAQRRRLSHFMDFVAASDTELHRLRRQQALLAYTTRIKAGGYWSINSDLSSFTVEDPLPCPRDKTTELAAIPGRLARIDQRVQERLVNWGYAVSDAALRSNVDRSLDAPSGFPYPATGIA
jgi:hypothetical protein